MRTATTVEASGAPWSETVDLVVEAEKLGLDVCWVAEAWGSDAPSPLGFLAARTERMLLGSGVIQVGTGVPFAHPLGRMRETVEVVRAVAAGEKVRYEGRHVTLPLPGGEARPMPASRNSYHDAYARQGFAEVAAEVRGLWRAGRREDAAAAVPRAMVAATTLIGTEDGVRDRLAVWRDAGVTTVRLYPAGATLDARLTTLARAIELVREVSR